MAELTDREERPADDAVRRSVRAVRARRRCAASASRSWRATATGTGSSPSELNFRANIFGFKMLGVEWILSASAVGSLQEAVPADGPRVPGSVHRSHARPHQHVLRQGHRRPRRVRASAVRPLATLAADSRASRRRDACIAAAPTSAWKGRSSRRWPNRSSTARGASTSSA